MPPPESIPASIVIPTRGRPAYLEVALSSIAPQASAAGAEVLVIDDAGPSPEARAQAQRFGARYEPHARELGLNVARNTGVERSSGELVVFVDDDIEADPGWLSALLTAASEHPEVSVFAGQIRPRLEGRGGWTSRSCRRELPPITTLQLGCSDTDTRYAWGANMAIRRATLARVGAFDVTLEHGGDEQEWQDRLRAAEPGARVLYVAGAVVDHRRTGADARLRRLARAQYTRGRAARRFDARRGQAPSLGRELRTLTGCLWHVARRGCPAGLTMVAHSSGRVHECLLGHVRPADTGAEGRSGCSGADSAGVSSNRTALLAASNSAGPPGQAVLHGQASGDDFLSGHSGAVGGVDGMLRGLRDRAIDAGEIATTRRLRLGLAARHEPPLRRVLAIGVVRPEHATCAARIRSELLRSRHEVDLRTCPPEGGGKFENLNRLLSAAADRSSAGPMLQDPDWVLVIDDDIDLPRGFLDRLLFLCERYDLQLAQPAHRLSSHAAWPVTRRQPGSVVRETGFVEIGPVTAFARATFQTLLPFPELRMGWGLDAHWAALAHEHGWRCGVIDAVAIGHRAAPAASSYSYEAAVTEAREFLAQRTLTTHRHW